VLFGKFSLRAWGESIAWFWSNACKLILVHKTQGDFHTVYCAYSSCELVYYLCRDVLVCIDVFCVRHVIWLNDANSTLHSGLTLELTRLARQTTPRMLDAATGLSQARRSSNPKSKPKKRHMRRRFTALTTNGMLWMSSLFPSVRSPKCFLMNYLTAIDMINLHSFMPKLRTTSSHGEEESGALNKSRLGRETGHLLPKRGPMSCSWSAWLR